MFDWIFDFGGLRLLCNGVQMHFSGFFTVWFFHYLNCKLSEKLQDWDTN